MKYKMIALIGQAGSGKDALLQRVLRQDPSLHEIVSYTTRPPREKEKDGKNYHFISTEEFTQLVLNDKMLEASSFNDWFYGTGIDDLDETKVNIGVFNPDGIDSMRARSDIDLVVFYIEATDKNRLIRQLNREEDPNVEEIVRRYKTDKEDFWDLDFHYNALDNNKKTDLKYNSDVICAAAATLAAKNN